MDYVFLRFVLQDYCKSSESGRPRLMPMNSYSLSLSRRWISLSLCLMGDGEQRHRAGRDCAMLKLVSPEPCLVIIDHIHVVIAPQTCLILGSQPPSLSPAPATHFHVFNGHNPFQFPIHPGCRVRRLPQAHWNRSHQTSLCSAAPELPFPRRCHPATSRKRIQLQRL